jgi:hypothetical protein
VKARDLLIVAAIVLVAGFAAADALRNGGSLEPAPAPTETEEPAVVERDEEPTEEERTLGRERFPRVPTSGTVIFTDAGLDCAVREVATPSGREFGNVVARSGCDLWVAPVTAKVAVRLGSPTDDTVPFRFYDLTRAQRNLGGYRALFGFVIWSRDGQRAAWCGGSRTGFDLELGGAVNRLDECPTAYTQENEVAFAIRNRLVVEGRTVLRADGGITFARFGDDGSLAIVVDGSRLERYERRRLTHAAEIPSEAQGAPPALSPDNCAALLRRPGFVDLLDVGCFAGAPVSVPGHAAAWSPNAEWIAVAATEELVFYRVSGEREVVRWPVEAAEIGWR